MNHVGNKLEEFQKKLEGALHPYDKEISNAIGFVEEISKKEKALLHGFVRMIGKDQNILRVLSYQPNEVYAKVLIEAA